MPLQIQKVEIEIQGLSQHEDERKRITGSLDVADNVEIVKAGRLTIRRGYRRIHTEVGADLASVRVAGNGLFHRLGVWRGGLVILGHTRAYAVVSRTNGIPLTSATTGIADRGRLGCSGIRCHMVATGERSTGEGGEAPS